MIDEFERLKNHLLESCFDANVFYYPNLGNWGDALIRHGTITFLKEIDIVYKELISPNDFELIDDSKRKVLLYGGGGGWCNLWSHSLRKVENLSPYFDRIIVLPSTYEIHHSLDNCVYFRRDDFDSKQIMPKAIFCPDMAFYINYETNIKGRGEGYFFREDQESSGKISIPEENFDISLKSNHYGSLDLFFDTIARYETIYTDRLHVAIAGAILNRKVHLYASSYFKIKAVYLSTLGKYFKNVNLIEN